MNPTNICHHSKAQRWVTTKIHASFIIIIFLASNALPIVKEEEEKEIGRFSSAPLTGARVEHKDQTGHLGKKTMRDERVGVPEDKRSKDSVSSSRSLNFSWSAHWRRLAKLLLNLITSQ